MSTQEAGLAALQSFTTQFQSFVTQQATDLVALTTAINTAIAALGANEDSAVQAAVTTLQGALSTVSAAEVSLEALSSSLTAAENPPAGK